MTRPTAKAITDTLVSDVGYHVGRIVDGYEVELALVRRDALVALALRDQRIADLERELAEVRARVEP